MPVERLNRAIRPAWFFDTSTYGGILTDISSHQIDQFLFYTGSTHAEVVAAQIANLRHPDHPAKLILCSTAASSSKKDIQVKVFERLGGAEAGAAARAFLEDPTRDATRDFRRLCGPLYHRNPHDRDIDARTIWNARLMAEFRRGERETMNFLPELHRIKCPTLVMVGEDDPMTPVPCSEEIVAALPPDLVRFERFADAGHGIVTDQPEQFFEVIRAFIAA